MMNNIHVILHEKPFDEGLDRTEAIDMINALIRPESFVPIEIEAKSHESSAMGFIDTKELERLSALMAKGGHKSFLEQMKEFIADILDDMNKETEDGMYTFMGCNIYLTRSTAPT